MKNFITLLFAMALLLPAAGCKDTKAGPYKPIRPVKAIRLDPSGAGKLWTFAGTAEDALESHLSFRVSGKIIRFPGDQIGRQFKTGQTVAQLDPTDYELELRQAQANLEQVRANFIRSKADVKRIRQLFERKVISKSELDQAEADFKSFEAQLSAAAKKLDIARKHLSYTTLPAPFDGWIGSVSVNVHQNVSAGQTVATLTAGRQMKMYVSVPDTLIAMVTEGDKVTVSFDALPDRSMTGRVTEISMGALGGSSYPVKVHLDNKDQAIRSGMTGHVTFLGQGKDTRIVIPPAALRSDPDGTRSVWVVDESDSTVHARVVDPGPLTPYGIEIRNGLESGDVLVIRGVHALSEGLKVRLLPHDLEG
ncbi:efflux RND transporter periplasmic adaptor subunit [Pseudodesulfovibrio tunisiensis]|uniref:efflux RND transporter periplasmic adaptor subunit n=1 Tax=Pseudodesulfovibrio tunisiensis TaxID=463192 RepID=UPI001FB3ECA8|nr:efflux RND transporter periplasmic adaptor subunit [Pseudodesulfovibrio tunisiensis]